MARQACAGREGGQVPYLTVMANKVDSNAPRVVSDEMHCQWLDDHPNVFRQAEGPAADYDVPVCGCV